LSLEIEVKLNPKNEQNTPFEKRTATPRNNKTTFVDPSVVQTFRGAQELRRARREAPRDASGFASSRP
jgi:hypothetical protein